MSRTTKIEWTDHTINFWVGCSPISAGCANCYAMKMAARCELMGQPAYVGTTRGGPGAPRWTGKINRNTESAAWGRVHKIRSGRVFVSSMTDFFHPDVPDAWRAEAIDEMDCAGHLTFQVLTKRPDLVPGLLRRCGRKLPDNAWIGATVEDGRVASRIDDLRKVDAAVRFLSVEPLTAALGRVDLEGVSWVITGGESGPRRRPCRAEWVREVRDQCVSSEVAFFHKQWGHWSDNPLLEDRPDGVSGYDWIKLVDPNGKGGSLLDGRLWKEFPDESGQVEMAI